MTWVWVGLAIIAVVFIMAAAIEMSRWNQICNYCNADGDPCPRCGGSGK